MKFHKRPDYGDFQDTNRKRLALARRQQRERDSVPLLAGLIAADQPDADTVMGDRAEQWRIQEQAERDRLAAQWRSIRADIYELTPEQRQAIHQRADQYGGPLNVVAYAYFIREVIGQHRRRSPFGTET